MNNQQNRNNLDLEAANFMIFIGKFAHYSTCYYAVNIQKARYLLDIQHKVKYYNAEQH